LAAVLCAGRMRLDRAAGLRGRFWGHTRPGWPGPSIGLRRVDRDSDLAAVIGGPGAGGA
jgi:hypothetical protein